jgi:hypothetical protein
MNTYLNTHLLYTYLLPLILLIALLIILLSELQYYNYPIKEGFETDEADETDETDETDEVVEIEKPRETRIVRNGKIIKRKKKISRKPIQEGIDFSLDAITKPIKDVIDKVSEAVRKITDTFKKVSEVYSKLTDFFNKVTDFFNKLRRIFNFIPVFFKYLSKFIIRSFDNISTAFKYIPSVFVWLGQYLEGGIRLVGNFSKCFKWYSLEALGHILYTPFKFAFWLFDLQSTENEIWDLIEEFDCMIKKATDFHIIHYSDDIQERCYAFCPPDFPSFPDLDWSFNPPTIDIRF